ncbi:MAG: alpha/beta hydrolase [Cyanobacteria bacterium J06639_1]
MTQTRDRTLPSLPVKHLILPTSGYRAAYTEVGTGAPVLLLHGFMGTHANWMPLAATLSDRYRCISLDLLGFGQSSKPDITYDIATEVAFVNEFVETLGLEVESLAIAGHSFGGWVASAYGLAYPERLSHLILCAPAGIRDDEFCGRYTLMRPLVWPTPVVDWGLTLARWGAGVIGKRDAVEWLSWVRRELMAQPVARQFLLSRDRPEDAIDTVEDQIHGLSVPTLILAGECDETIPLWHCETYRDRIPNARLHILPGASHALPMDHGQEMMPFVTTFLDEA